MCESVECDKGRDESSLNEASNRGLDKIASLPVELRGHGMNQGNFPVAGDRLDCSSANSQFTVYASKRRGDPNDSLLTGGSSIDALDWLNCELID